MNPGKENSPGSESASEWTPGAPCFHCEEALPGDPLYARVNGQDRPVCCRGCQAVAQLIDGARLHDFYRFREQAGPRPEDSDKDIEDPWAVYDREGLRKNFVTPLADGAEEASILIEGMRCAACSWLIERSIAPMAGIQDIRINPTTGRGLIRFDPARLRPSAVFARIASLGYRPHAAGTGAWEAVQRKERHRALRRLAVAGLGMMQVMTFAVSLYAGAFQGMDPGIREFLRLVSLLVATPVAFYAGWPFFQGALRDLRGGSPGMDVPVSLAIGVAYLASVWNTLVGSGEVYFDSVTMFVFFLSLGRYLEMMARHRAGDTADALARTVPRTAIRLQGDTMQRVGVDELQDGDLVLARPGDTLPCDGIVMEGSSGVDESLLTGEADLQTKSGGDRVLGGSTNISRPLRIQVTATGSRTVIASITRLLERAQSERPRLARLANRVAAWFVLGVLVMAAAVAWFWYAQSPERAMAVTLAVLVVTCPCALSLATPAALTAATSHLAGVGVLVTRAHAVESMARVNRVIFDKTGTLTTGKLAITAIHARHDIAQDRALALAAALERECNHPIASMFEPYATALAASGVEVVTGRGVQGVIGSHTLRIGQYDFVSELFGTTGLSGETSGDSGEIVLGDSTGVLARFELRHQLRPEAGSVIAGLRAMGIKTELASGDSLQAVQQMAGLLEVDDFHANLLPADKLALVRRRQSQGDIVMMIGDGINDAPVLAGADVSLAMGSGAALAQSSADSILLAHSLDPVILAIATVRKTMQLIRQNLTWALAYNLTALPLAAAGMVEPWMAAIGMSASSLLVVLNALRASRVRAPAPERSPGIPAMAGGQSG